MHKQGAATAEPRPLPAKGGTAAAASPPPQLDNSTIKAGKHARAHTHTQIPGASQHASHSLYRQQYRVTERGGPEEEICTYL